MKPFTIQYIKTKGYIHYDSNNKTYFIDACSKLDGSCMWLTKEDAELFITDTLQQRVEEWEISQLQ